VPEARHALEFIEFVAAMVKTNRLHLSDPVGVYQLFGFQFVMKLPSPLEIF
jgi:hypothetical protein